MSTPVRASRLRAVGKTERPADLVGAWALATSRCATFGIPAPIVKPTPMPANRSQSLAVSRIPIRRILALQTRSTSPIRSIPSEGHTSPSASFTSIRPASEVDSDRKTEPDRVTPKQTLTSKQPQLNILARQRHMAIRKAGDGIGCQSIVKAENAHRKVIETNKVRAIEVQKKKLENMQSDFMHKLRSLGPQGIKIEGTFKFISVVLNDECKVVVHEDDLLRLPKNLPLDSINDLKDRCRTVIDLGLMMLYEYLPHIQRASNECEARNKREDIRFKLQNLLDHKMIGIAEEIDQLCGSQAKNVEAANSSLYREMADLRLQKQHAESRYFEVKKEHCEELNQLQIDYEAKLASQLASRDQTITELRKSLKRAEELVAEQSIRLAERNATRLSEDTTIEELRAELDKLKASNQRMIQRLEETTVGMERAQKSVDKHLAKIAYLEGELKEARELIVNLQKRPDTIDKGVREKDVIISDLRLQLQNLEQHKNMLNKQVNTTLKRHADLDSLNEKHKQALEQIKELSNALKSTSKEAEIHAKAEEELRKEVAKMRDQIELDQQMLTARSDLINRLQKLEHENRLKLEQMYFEVSEKDTMINQVNNELASKEEESHNLFGTLKHKQTEVKRQEHIIQLLKDQNERLNNNRAKQDERNVLMQEEIKHLKHTLRDYSKIIIGNNGRHFFEVVPAVEVRQGDGCSGDQDRVDTPISDDISSGFPPKRLRTQQQSEPPRRGMSPPHGRFFEPLHHQLRSLGSHRSSSEQPHRSSTQPSCKHH
ncbi:ELKS/Rab6-interacting/CAST family member 1 isoform X2 [Drosophila ficusphila]|uniref:ELKS/Rab6-interacting/CAST family member 1 isoform X2 n=1 Tax=Drosophila ficusphila TaxID=30025 RepID=UPI0007E5BF27|nr:ELKS/Rab6-interacting/CAST family member 1 isoform X2 [Drosophila ficusphila]